MTVEKNALLLEKPMRVGPDAHELSLKPRFCHPAAALTFVQNQLQTLFVCANASATGGAAGTLTVMLTGADVTGPPPSIVATAVRMCEPLAAPLQRKINGNELSEPMNDP